MTGGGERERDAEQSFMAFHAESQRAAGDRSQKRLSDRSTKRVHISPPGQLEVGIRVCEGSESSSPSHLMLYGRRNRHRIEEKKSEGGPSNRRRTRRRHDSDCSHESWLASYMGR